MPALPHRDVAAAIATVRASNAAEAVKLAFEFLVLTAARWGEARWARWTEMDTSDRVWTIPAVRMKANREHRVPLCRRAGEVLDAAQALGDNPGPLVFPDGDGEPLDEKVLRRLLERHKVPAVPHGFRSSFRDWAAEETEHRREVIEAALAHLGNKVEAAYARSDLFERRRTLMDDWVDYIEGTDLSPQNERDTESPEPAAP
ncbi:MAG: site-specific integrase [Gammaproteobacteria bacterium]|nr:site-specific integrase [Gammaproteobacteria bacterium]